MAVSMLAGCAGKGTDDKTDTTDLSAAVVAALSSDTTKKVTFTENADLEKAIAAVEKKVGTNGFANGLNATAINAANDKFSSQTELTSLAAVNSQTDIDNNVKTVSATRVLKNVVTTGASVEYAVKTMAAKIDSDIKAFNNTPAESGVYTLNGVSGRITYSYTGNICVYTTTAEDTGVVTYYLVYTLTRTGVDAKV